MYAGCNKRRGLPLVLADRDSKHENTRGIELWRGSSYESPQSLDALLGNIDSIELIVRFFPCCTGEVNLAG